jgi:AcrR family transcriptional regulator
MPRMSADTAPRWNRLEPDERTRQILLVAVRLFGEHSYEQVSIADVAAAAGVARGLVHRYFGSKRGLYLAVVRYVVTPPPLTKVHLPDGDLPARISTSIDWLLTAIEAHSRTWLAAMGAAGVGADPDVHQILDEADEAAAQRVLETVGFLGSPADYSLAVSAITCFGGMTKAASREWLVRRRLNRDQVHALLSEALLGIVQTALPRMGAIRTIA